jgi:hypothetical protein
MFVNFFGVIFLNFEAALKLLRAFSACNPRIFKEFAGFPNESSREVEKGYVLFVDIDTAKKDCFCELEAFAKTNDLYITPYREVYMVSGPTKNLY